MIATAPIDSTHAESAAAIERIRQAVAVARRQVAAWQPRPFPS